MPLRLRLIVVIGLMLLVSLAGGSLQVAWRAAGRVRTELNAALNVGANTVRNGLRDLSLSDDRVGGITASDRDVRRQPPCPGRPA